MPVKFEGDSPSKVCPRCEPHLAAVAGSGSTEQGISREPSFTRRKKLPGHDRQVTFTTDYTECGTSTAEDNMALKFKAGYRRVNNSAHPSTYQMNYRYRKDPVPSAGAPLIEAANQLQQASQSQKPSRTGISSEHAHQPPVACPVHKHSGETPMAVRKSYTNGAAVSTKENIRPGSKQRRTPVEPLALPGSDSRDEIPTGPLRTRDTKVRAGNNPVSSVHKQKRKSNSPARVGVEKRRKYSSPLKRLYERDYQRQGLAKALFQTQYQLQYKDWLQETGGAVGKEGKAKIEQAPPFTYGSLPVRGDPTDPRYLKHLPHPPLPHYPPDLHWRTNYGAHFVEPSVFKYERGAWKSPDPEKAASPGEGGAEPGPRSTSAADGVERGQPSTEPAGSWFDQLLELRNKADHYKWKSRRTNFNIHDMLSLDPPCDVRRTSDDATSSSTILPVNSCSSSGSPVSPSVVPRSERTEFKPEPDLVVPKPRPGSVGREFHPAPQQSDPLEIEDIEDSDREEDFVEAASRRSPGVKAAANTPVFPSGDVKCTCAHERSNQGRVKGRAPTPGCKVKGRVSTPELRKSASPTRHHLDLTTPSDNGLLIPMTTYPHVSPNFRRDMKSSTAPINPLPVDSVDHLIKDSREKAMKAVREEVSSVSKHIPASSSPHHSHCVPNGIPVAGVRGPDGTSVGARGGGTREVSHIPNGVPSGPGTSAPSAGARRGGKEATLHIPNGVPTGSGAMGGGRGTKSPHHVRKLDFERLVPSQPAPRQPSYQTRPTSLSGSSAPSLSCQTCGACLQPSIVPPPSSLARPGPGDGRPKVQTLYPATLNRRPATTLGQPRSISAQNVAMGTEKRGGKSAVSQKHGSARELFTAPTPVMEVSRSPTPPRANTYAPAAYGGAYAGAPRPKPSYHTLEVDELSLSSMSLSSCSVASDVLEKARKRRDNFWTSQHQSRE